MTLDDRTKQFEDKIKTLSANLAKKEKEKEDVSQKERKNAEDRQKENEEHQKENEEHQNEIENMQEQLR